jgi:ribosomal protein L7/L12
MDSGNKIEAIKLYRSATGVGLKEAKEAVEEYADTGRLPMPGSGAGNAGGAAHSRRTNADVQAEIQALVSHGKKIEAIKLYREHTGQGLAESKARIDEFDATGTLGFPESNIAAMSHLAGVDGDTGQPAAPVEDGVVTAILSLIKAKNVADAIAAYQVGAKVSHGEAKRVIDDIAGPAGDGSGPNNFAANQEIQTRVVKAIRAAVTEGNTIEAYRVARRISGASLDSIRVLVGFMGNPIGRLFMGMMSSQGCGKAAMVLFAVTTALVAML